MWSALAKQRTRSATSDSNDDRKHSQHSTQLYCSRGLFAVALLSFLLCSLAVLVRDEDAAQVEEDGSWSTGLSALMGELSEASIWYRGEETPAVRASAVAVV